jgi:hypothetical protein
VKDRTAGASLQAIVAAEAARRVAHYGGLFSGRIADPGRSGVSREEAHGVVLITTNYVNVVKGNVESRLTWHVAHRRWNLRVTARSRLTADGSFEKVAPYQVGLDGDLLDAARYLGLAREIFFDALRADGWTQREVSIESLRWLDLPYVPDAREPSQPLRLP